MDMDRHIAVPVDVLNDLLAHLTAASRQLVYVDEQSVVLAAAAALLNVDHCGRVVATLIGRRAVRGAVPAAAGANQMLVAPAPGQPATFALVDDVPPALDEFTDDSITSCPEVRSC